MATTPTKPEIESSPDLGATRLPSWPSVDRDAMHWSELSASSFRAVRRRRPAGGDALQALLAFSSLHQQIRRRQALAQPHAGFETKARPVEFEAEEQFVLDDVLQLVAERAIAITGADGLGIALAENNEIVLRASAGEIKPDVGARIQRDSSFSGACFRTAQIIRCDDTETDDRVNLEACRELGARSMVAVPLCGRRRVIGLLEAFSTEPFGFNDRDIGSLGLLAELIVGALKPEDEDRFAESARVAEAELMDPPAAPASTPMAEKYPVDKPLTGASLAPQIENAPPIEKQIEKAPEAAPTKIAAGTKPDHEPAPFRAVESKLETAIQLSEEISPTGSANRHPGMVLVLVLVVIAALAAAGLWWKLKNTQLGEVVIHPQEQFVKRSAAIKRPATPLVKPSTVTSSNAISANPTNSPDHSTPARDNAMDEDISSANSSASSPELSKMPRVTSVRHWSSDDSSTVVLDLEDQVQYEAHRLANPDRIYFDLHDTALAPDIAGKNIEIGDALLARVRVAQPAAGLTRVVLETRGASNYSVSLEPNPYRLVVQVHKPGANPKAQVDLFPGAANAEHQKIAGFLSSIVIPPPGREDLQWRAKVPKLRIVVDAGHGGWDLGTVGRRGLLEKDLVLEIAQRLGKLLQSRLGADVILTRNDDNYIPLDERAGIANQAQADLFVSVHANYSDLPSARGVETYYTNFFSPPGTKDVEPRPDGTSDKNSGTGALSPADLHDRIEQSRRLAASVQRSLYGTLSVQNPGLRDRGVKEASYVVLTETAMPGILAEVSFVSSPADEQKLRSDGYREQIAEALYKGIARYAASSHSVKMASTK